ncbi:HAD-IIIA family hydrolase [Candidatus Pacearchaeota archaeon]|nr:HAD-IIIA family hydrolase [Candidatus Pacearchaeota archaeon]
MEKSTIFLDFYGTIVNKDSFGIFLRRLGIGSLKPKYLRNAVKGLKEMSMDNRLVLISNQAAIGYGIIQDKDFKQLLERFDAEMKEKGIIFDGIYYCPHRISEKCPCRKPEPGMLEKAVQELKIELNSGWMIGDQTCDISLGKNKNLQTILVTTGYAGNDGHYKDKPDYVAADLYNASQIIKFIKFSKEEKND